MPPFSASDIVRLWEEGSPQHPLDRALTILVRACPEIGREMLARLTIGQRDALLLELREQAFGERMEAYAECPQCGERLEFPLSTTAFRPLSGGLERVDAARFRFEEGGADVTFRLPDSRDLAAAARCAGIEEARSLLVRRCILEADGSRGTTLELPDAVITAISGRMSELDTAGDILLKLECPACRAAWQQAFDIVSFFWTEIAVHAKRLLREVHALARAYGWGEGEILSLSPERRSFYLEMIEG